MIAPLRLGYYKLAIRSSDSVLPQFVFYRAIGRSLEVGPLQETCLLMRFQINTKWVQTLSVLRRHIRRVPELVDVRSTVVGGAGSEATC
jgi:hypothetical protein